MTFIFKDRYALELLMADVAIHRFIDVRRKKTTVFQHDEQENEIPAYSSTPFHYEVFYDDGPTWCYIQTANIEETRWGPAGHAAKAFAYHYPTHLADMQETASGTDDDASFWRSVLKDLNEEGIPSIVCHNVPDYHLTGNHLELVHELIPGMRFNMQFQHPRVDLTLTIGDYSKTFSVIGEDERPSHIMNAGYALAVADYLSTL